MSKERKRSGYHFEFINPRQTKKYKFYFFDYLYYMGGGIYHENKWGESSWRMSGFSALIWYWGLILYPFLSIGLGYIENSDTELAIMCGWGMFPVFFCFFRYRKARKYALMNYYEGKILPKQINCSTIKYPLENEYILHQPKQLSSPTVLTKNAYAVYITFRSLYIMCL